MGEPTLVEVVNSVQIQDSFSNTIQTYFGQIRLIEQITFGDMLLAFLFVILIVLILFSIIQKSL